MTTKARHAPEREEQELEREVGRELSAAAEGRADHFAVAREGAAAASFSPFLYRLMSAL